MVSIRVKCSLPQKNCVDKSIESNKMTGEGGKFDENDEQKRGDAD